MIGVTSLWREANDAVRYGFSHWRDFKSRASRKIYWQWVLIFINIEVMMFMISSFSSIYVQDVIELTSRIFYFITCIPLLSIQIRRLHDINRSGWWYLISLIPIIGWIIVIYWTILKGDKAPNKYGPPFINSL